MIAFTSKKLPILHQAEVVVCGGGPAGIAAALAAARVGCKTALIEKAIFAGGMTTGGLQPCIVHMTSDGKNIVAAGICKEVVDTTVKRMSFKPNYCWQNVDPEILKKVYDEMLTEAGVKVYFGLTLAEVIMENDTLQAVVVATPQGLEAVKGKYFIDATGDGHISAWSGAPFEVGGSNGEVMSPTLCTMFTGFSGVEQLGARGRTEWAEAMKAGTAPLEENHLVGFFRHDKNAGSGNLGHIYGANTLNPDDITRCGIEGRQQARKFIQFFNEHVPGFADARLSGTGSLIGARESRRIMGEYVMTKDDYFARQHFADDIGTLAYPVDIHASTPDPDAQSRVEQELQETRYKTGESYGIPYRALLPQKTTNLLVAGRCISTDRTMQSSIRIVPGCFVTGQAAGTAAAMACQNQTTLRNLNIDDLQKKLIQAKAIIHKKTE
jgi:hypothetical protein